MTMPGLLCYLAALCLSCNRVVHVTWPLYGDNAHGVSDPNLMTHRPPACHSVHCLCALLFASSPLLSHDACLLSQWMLLRSHGMKQYMDSRDEGP